MIQIPKLSFSDIARFYSLIRVSHLGIASPIECAENTVSRSWEAPTHPTEIGLFVGDTIYEEPKSISMSVLIQSGLLPVFEAQIKLANELGVGFNIFTLGGVYSNMFVVSFTRPERPDVSTGYMCDITFQEIPQAGLLNDIINISITAASSAVSAAVNTINSGSVQPVASAISEIGDTALQWGLSV